jgi:hypothetical protein
MSSPVAAPAVEREPTELPLPGPQLPAIERGGGLHLHLHGVSAEDVAAIIECHRLDG